MSGHEPDEDALETLLREAFARDVLTIEPGEGLTAVRSRVEQRSPWLRWRPLVAAAATAAVVAGGGAFAVSSSLRTQQEPAGTNRSTAVTPRPPASTKRTALPVYYLGADGTRQGLFREFHQVDVPAAAPAAAVAVLAVTSALDGGSAVDPDYGAPWLAATSSTAHLTRGADVLTVDLPSAEATARGRTREQARLAVQQLAWTASAAAQDAGVGVRVLVSGAPGMLFGSLPVGDVVHRPGAATAYRDLASVWVQDVVSRESNPGQLSVSGSACVFEGALRWQLLQGRRVVRSGSTTASAGCPSRGTWDVSVGAVPTGRYTFRAFAEPASGKGPATQDTREIDWAG